MMDTADATAAAWADPAGEKQPLLAKTLEHRQEEEQQQQQQPKQQPQPQQKQPKHEQQQQHLWLWSDDILDTIRLAIPIFCSMVSWVGMKTTDSALLGHVSSDALAAASLSDLWTMCTAPFLNASVLGVLVSGAIGAGNAKLARIYLQVSCFVLSMITILVMIAWNMTEYVWRWWATNDIDPHHHLAHMAGYYSRILSISLPAQVIYSQLAQFFSAQRIMQPEVTASLVGLLANLILGLVLVLGVLVPTGTTTNGELPPPPPQEPHWHGYGFAACPIVTASVTMVQFLVLYGVYCQFLRQPYSWGNVVVGNGDGAGATSGSSSLSSSSSSSSWSKWWHEISTGDRLSTYWHLYLPSALSLASDFWRVAVIGSIAVRQLGQDQVAIFNTSYRIMWIVLILVNAVSAAAGIKTTLRLGQFDVIGAQRATWVGIYLSVTILTVLAVLVLYHIRWLGRIFTNDPVLLDLFADATVPFTITLVLMNLSVALERVPFSMGRTKEVFWSGFIASWAFQVPAVMVMTTYWRQDLIGLYSGMAIGYFVLAVLYGGMVINSDWDKYAADARRRSEMPVHVPP